MLRILGFKTEMRRAKRVDWVQIASADAMRENGELSVSTWHQVERLRPREGTEDNQKRQLMQARWALIEPAYQAWIEGNAIPETGTPLGAWHGITADQAESLRAVGIATVEQLAGASENLLSRPPLPNMRDMQRQAKLYLEGADKAEADRKIADLEAKLETALEMLSSQKEAEKPRRGRPPKAKPAENEAA